MVTITEEFLKVEHQNRKPEQIFWKDISEIRLKNSSDGPSAPDVWLVLVGDHCECLIPQGTNGYDAVFSIVSQYKNFNFDNVIKSMTCVNNDQFILWTRE